MNGNPDPEQSILRISIVYFRYLHFIIDFTAKRSRNAGHWVGGTNLIIPAMENTTRNNGEDEMTLTNLHLHLRFSVSWAKQQNTYLMLTPNNLSATLCLMWQKRLKNHSFKVQLVYSIFSPLSMSGCFRVCQAKKKRQPNCAKKELCIIKRQLNNARATKKCFQYISKSNQRVIFQITKKH